DVASQVQGPLAVVGSGLVHEARFPQALQQLIEVRDPDLQPRAAAIAQLAQVSFKRGETLTPEQVQPIYLRDEVAWKKLPGRSEEHTSELQSRENLVCRLLLEKKNDERAPDGQHAHRQRTS